MLKNENIICISSIDWDFIWQGHQEIMSAFAKHGNRVLFIENTGVRSPRLKDIPRLKKRIISWFKSVKGFRNEMDNLFVYSPIALPFPYSRIARWVNKHLVLGPLKRWVRIMEFYDPIVWTFLPTGIALDIIDALDGKSLVYYYIADFDALTDNPRKLKKTEEALIKRSDAIFAQGKMMLERCRKYNNNVHLFPFGVNIDVFEEYLRRGQGNRKAPAELKDIKKPIIGYVGGVHKYIDAALLKYIAEVHPDWSIVLVGPRQTELPYIEKLPNITQLGKREFTELPSYIDQFDVCIIPYIISDYTLTVYPTKLNEYHIMGKPVVSTALPEVEEFNRSNGDIVYIGATHKEFTDLIQTALDDNKGRRADMRVASANKNRWSERIEKMSGIIEEALLRKEADRANNWQERFLLLYKRTRTHILRVLLEITVSWFLIFHTPAVWYLAQPLKVAEPPEQADAVVVLAGGVGESGKAGQGYEERVKYAVELYKNSFSDKIIFSSGYTYAFKETSIMKALAVSLGVPKDAIVLDDKAKNTYENVVFSGNIMRARGWKKALLVSSPYHMRRASLVCKKIAPDIKFVSTPIPKSIFYGEARRFDIEQMIALLHEYLGLVYYWFKGYV